MKLPKGKSLAQTASTDVQYEAVDPEGSAVHVSEK
jgi:hypothetical protein